MQSGKNPSSFGKTLSPFESEIAALAKAGYSRRGIAAALGIAPGTVKTALRDVRRKLGPNWLERLQPGGEEEEAAGAGGGSPAPEWQESSGAAATGMPPPLWESAAPPGEKWQREALEGRRLAATLLLRTSSRTILKVSGCQRFFLRPLLSALEAEGCLRVLATDRYDRFDPPWLPLVNRGRGALRGASFVVLDEARVRQALEQYLEGGLACYVQELVEAVAGVRALVGRWRYRNLPTAQEIWRCVREAFGSDGVAGDPGPGAPE